MCGAAAIYCITPVAEEVARAMAATLGQSPVAVWDLPDEWRRKINARELPAIEFENDADDAS